MFWKVSGFSVTSPIDALLDKSQFTLEELLVEDDLIQECRSLNGRLINFLGNKENVEAMLRYMLEPPNDASETESKRFSWQCCEVFCCEVDPIFSVLLENVDTMSLFLSLLDSKEPLHTATAGYFGRVMSHLLIRRPVQLAQFLMSYPSYISKFIDHLEDTSITEVVIRLMGADEQTNAQLPASYVDWISRMDALKSVVDRLDASELDRVQFNAAQVLNAVIRVQPLSLATELASDAHLERLTQSLFTKDGGVSVPVLSVVIYALDPKMRIYNGLRPNCEILDRENVLFKSLVQKLSTLLPILTEKIKPKETDEIQPTPYGCLKPPLGFARLKIVQVLSILMDAKSKTIFDAVLEAGTLETLMDLFVSYPFNNALHKEIVLIFMRALSSEHRPTIECLFTKLKICQWLMELPQNVHSKMTLFRPHDSNSLKNGPSEETNESASPKLRAGYLGHAIQISNIIEQAAATHPEISRHIESYTEWQKYFASVVEPVNQKEDLDAWECGRPTDGIPRISEDDENRNPPSSSISNPNKLFGDDEEDDPGMSWGTVDVLTRDQSGVTATAAMLAKLELQGQTGRNTTDSSSSSSSHSSSTDSSGTESSEEDSEEPNLVIVSPQSLLRNFANDLPDPQRNAEATASTSNALNDELSPPDTFNEFNYWRVDIKDPEMSEEK